MRTYSMKYTIQVPCGHELADVDCIVEFKCYPGRPAVMYLRNGDPGYPEDPAEIEVISVKDGRDDYTESHAEMLSEDDNFCEAAWQVYEAANTREEV